VTDRRALLVLAALAMFAALYPALFGERPAPLGSSVLLLPDPRAPRDRNDELSDVVTQFVPWSEAVAAAYRVGRLPARFPWNGCGTPLWSNPQAQAVTPTTLFFLLLPAAWASAAGAAVKLFAGAAGTFLFARVRGLTRVSALWAGLAYGLALHSATWMHFPHTWPVALFPFALLALERVARAQPRGFAATVGVVTLLLMGGYPETEFLVAVAGAAYFTVRILSEKIPAAERWRRFGRGAGAALLGLGLTAAYTLPATLTLARSQRSVQVARSTPEPAYLAWRDFLGPPTYWTITRFWIVPEAQGNPRDLDKFGPYSFAGRTSGYAGILVLTFALASAFVRRPPRFVAAARAAAVLLGLYVLWYPPLVFLLHRAPGIREAASRLTTNRANTILVLLLAILAAFELDRIRRGGGLAGPRAACLIVLAGLGLVTLEYVRTMDRPALTPWRAVSFAVPALLLTGALLLLARPMSARRGRFLALFLVAGTAVDLLRIGARINPGTRPDEDYPISPGVRALQSATAGGRFASPEATLTGMAFPYGLEDVRVLNPAGAADFEDVLIAAAGYTGPDRNVPRITRMDAPFLDFLNVRAGVSANAAPTRRSAPAAILPERLTGVRDLAELLARLPVESDFVRQAFVVGPTETFSGNASLLGLERPRPEEIRARVRVESPRVLVIPETTDGGWRAETAGLPLPTLTANGAFLAVRVPAGENEIVCRYTPPGLFAGASISAGSAALLGLLALASLRRGSPRPSGRALG